MFSRKSGARCVGARLAAALLTLVTAYFFSVTASAQQYAGSVTGTVTDPSGAVVPNARLQLVDEQKGFAFTAVSDSTGGYVIRQVPPGTYKLSVEAQGFRAETQSGIKLDISQNITVNFALQVGAVTQTLQISEAAPLLSTQDAVTGQTVDRKFINDLPLISRSVTDLAYLTPGITEVATGTQNSAQNNFVSNGGRNATADMLLDGVTVTNFEQNSGIQVPSYTPSVDAVEEFTVQQTNFSAEYGFSGGTIVNMLTRSGTNQFHGSLYEFFRNQRLDANNWFNNQSGVPIPALKNNNFGGTVGGPIRRDKTFFFFDYDGTRSRTGSTYQAGVPSAAERTGNFGELCGYAGGSFDANGLCSAGDGQLWDPYTGVYSADAGGPVRSGYIPFNNITTYTSPGSPVLNGTPYQLPARPGNLIDPAALKLMQFYPLPNENVGTSAYNPYTNWIGSGSNQGSNNQYDIKVDHRFSDKDLFSAKYSRQGGFGHGFNCYGNVADPCTSGPSTGTAHLAALNLTHTFTPTLLMNLALGFTRSTNFTHSIAGDYKNLDPVSLLGMPKYIDASGFPSIPAISLNTGYTQPVSSPASIGTQAWSHEHLGSETYHLLGTVSWIKGQHELKFGGEGRMHRINYTQPGVPAGYFVYDFTGTSQQPFSGGGDALASFLVGNGGPGTWGQYEIPNLVSTQSFQAGGFIQDNWKVNKKLTVNIGMRYDLDFPRTERYNRMNALDPSVVSPVQAPGLGTLHGGEIFASSRNRSPGYKTAWNDLGPRLSIAYQPIEKTVIRAGYGIYYSTVRSGAAGTGGTGYQGYDENTPWINTYQNDGVTPWGRLSNPFPTGVKLPPGGQLGLLNDVGFGAAGPIPSIDSAVPYEQSWSFGIERELPGNFLVDANYIGKAGHHLYFGGAGGLNYLGPQIEHYSSQQIAALNTYVPNPFSGIITDPSSSLSSPTVQASQLQLPFPQFTGFSGDEPPWANSIYNALQLRVEKRFSHGLQALVTYTWSKSIDDASTTSGGTTWLGGITSLQDPNNRRLERSLSTFDIPRVLQFSYVYELPIGRGKAIGGNMPPVLNAIIGGWQTNGIWRFTDGRPILLGLSGGQSLPTYGGQRPNLIAPLHCNSGPDFLTNYFANPDVAVAPPPFTLGNAPRSYGGCRARGQNNATLSLFKDFLLPKLREGARLQFRFEAFNALNHPQFDAPNVQVNGGNFGVITSTANGPREVQLALKLYF
ncbi:MAG: carboxypeptidase regulatory-like domain-containing protein [Bryobacteraceae bacterium]